MRQDQLETLSSISKLFLHHHHRYLWLHISAPRMKNDWKLSPKTFFQKQEAAFRGVCFRFLSRSHPSTNGWLLPFSDLWSGSPNLHSWVLHIPAFLSQPLKEGTNPHELLFFKAILTSLLLPAVTTETTSISQTRRWRSMLSVFDFGLFVPLGCCCPPTKIWTNKKEESKQMCHVLWSISDRLNTQKEKRRWNNRVCVRCVCEVDPPVLLY